MDTMVITKETKPNYDAGRRVRGTHVVYAFAGCSYENRVDAETAREKMIARGKIYDAVAPYRTGLKTSADGSLQPDPDYPMNSARA